jgi:hypothetical protein
MLCKHFYANNIQATILDTLYVEFKHSYSEYLWTIVPYKPTLARRIRKEFLSCVGRTSNLFERMSIRMGYEVHV